MCLEAQNSNLRTQIDEMKSSAYAAFGYIFLFCPDLILRWVLKFGIMSNSDKAVEY